MPMQCQSTRSFQLSRLCQLQPSSLQYLHPSTRISRRTSRLGRNLDTWFASAILPVNNMQRFSAVVTTLLIVLQPGFYAAASHKGWTRTGIGGSYE